MNPGSEHQPPTHPHPVPGGQFEPPTQPPTLPPMPPPVPLPPRPPRRRPWILPVVAATLVVLVGAGAGAYLLYGQLTRGQGIAGPPATGQPSTAGLTKPAAVTGPDVCAMLPKEEAERLVPGATVSKDSRDSEYTVNFSCNWNNQRISHGEWWRSREVDVKVQQHRGDGAKTGRAMAQNSYEVDYGGAKYAETAKPTPKKGEKDYTSPVTDIQGAGDAAFAQYTWRRSGSLMWYSYGKAYARVQDITIEVRYQASQQRKDAQILSNETTQSVTESNAIREVSGLVKHFAKGVADWKARHPDVLAQPYKAATASPSAAATPSPTPLVVFPPVCETVTPTAAKLVPGHTPRARGLEVGDDTQTECRWLNLDVPAGDKVTKIRSVLITVHSFTNRAGVADETAARSFYTGQLGGDKNLAQSSLGGISWGKVRDVPGLGEEAYSVYVGTRKGEVFAGSGTVTVRRGAVVVEIDYAGAQRPKGEPAASGNVVLIPEKEGLDGALTMAKAFMQALSQQPVGS
ncbi:hypothetical protein [Nonomuraea sp. NPDC049725]|uniref:hypothetical protein n=1 Tax=Nonomuraea sp. NPDC049725 TaxID=3154508 RepID=UPI003429ED6F